MVSEDARHCFVLYLCKWCSVDGKITSGNDAAECGKMVHCKKWKIQKNLNITKKDNGAIYL
jgi:hypothetical protein